MSLSSKRQIARVVILASVLSTLSACGFRPLYGDPQLIASTGVSSKENLGKNLSSIAFMLLNTREGIVFRNNLIFGLTGGGNENPNPLYRLDYNIIKASSPFTVEAISGRQSASFVTLTVSYTLVELAGIKTVFRGQAIGRASFDKPAQRFAAIRAERDAEDRAAQDVADSIRNALASYFAQKDKPTS